MTKNAVSILITNYNKSLFLKKTIRSCLNQNYKEKEIIVFDDCSTDNSINILKNFEKLKIMINKKNRNIGSHCSCGYSNAKRYEYFRCFTS